MDSGRRVLLITNMLSPQTKAGPSIVIPVTSNLHLSPLMVSIPFFMARNLTPKSEVSAVSCCSENQISGAELRNNTKKPVRKHLMN
jgi:hypothetical protein